MPIPADLSTLAQQALRAEVAQCHHSKLGGRCDGSYFKALEQFVSAGLAAGEAVVIIATAEHRKDLRTRLQRRGIYAMILDSFHSWVELDVEETLQRCMAGGWPDERLFQAAIGDVLALAGGYGRRRMRVFSEMAALLSAWGCEAAGARLDAMWLQLGAQEDLVLFGIDRRAACGCREPTVLQDATARAQVLL
jgi:hypothetical protein